MSTLGSALCPNPCETCEKKGLPVLLVRPGVIAKELSAPALSANFSSGVTASITLGDHAQYTQRLLRSGYVYVYDERYQNQWDEYFVSADGYLTKLPKRMAVSSTPPKPPTIEFACARTGARPMASLITIRNAKHAKTVWFGFSDVQWTEAVMRLHNDASYRQQHMSKIALSGGKIASQKWSEPLEQVRDLIPEYSGRMNTALSKVLLQDAVPFQFNQRDAEYQSLMSAYAALCPKGGAAIVMLADPVGIAAELAHLMEYRKVSFIARKEYQRPMGVASAIAGMEYALKEQAKLAEIAAGKMLAQRYEQGYETPVSFGAPDPFTIDTKLAAQMRTSRQSS